MTQSANITSIEALRLLKAAVVTFEEEVQAAIVALEMEARRPVEWIEHDRKQYWPKQVRKASDEVSEARLALQRCELTISGEDNRSCYDERKALQKAKKRLEKGFLRGVGGPQPQGAQGPGPAPGLQLPVKPVQIPADEVQKARRGL